MSRYVVFSGFLGAGKTTSMIAFANALRDRGKRAAILVNDLGAQDLVDGTFTAEAGCCCEEITGGCICYQTENLVEHLRSFRDSSHADMIFSDIPGCGIGALDHVYHTLARDYPDEFVISPFTVVADPERLRMLMPGEEMLHLPEEMRFLFDAQLKEAEIILLNKIDTLSEEEKETHLAFLGKNYPQARAFAISALCGEGIEEVLDELMRSRSALPVRDIGYGSDAFMAAEKRLCWYNRKLVLRSQKGGEIDGNAFVEELAEAIRKRLMDVGRNVPHLKILARGLGGMAKLSLLGVDYPLSFDSRLAGHQRSLNLVINARAACEPGILDFLMNSALMDCCGNFELEPQIFFTECFSMASDEIE